MAINFNKAEFILSATVPAQFVHDGLPQVAFAGRSNVGKSSVINRVVNRKNFARVGASPGKRRRSTTSKSTAGSTSSICPATATRRSPRPSATAGAA